MAYLHDSVRIGAPVEVFIRQCATVKGGQVANGNTSHQKSTRCLLVEKFENGTLVEDRALTVQTTLPARIAAAQRVRTHSSRLQVWQSAAASDEKKCIIPLHARQFRIRLICRLKFCLGNRMDS